MARELKVGIAVIGLLLVVFCGLLAKRLTRPTKLPLSNVSSAGTTKPDTAAAKPATPIVRPTMIPPQAEPNKSQDYAWTPSSGPASNDSRDQILPQDRYSDQTYSPHAVQKTTESTSATANQPNLLAAPLPIQDLENKQPTGSGNAVPYQSAYAAAVDTPESKSSSTVDNTKPQQPVDPFQYPATKNSYPPTAASSAPATPYQDDAVADRSQPAPVNDQYSYPQSSARTPVTPSGSYRESSPVAVKSQQQYPSESYTGAASSRATPPANLPAQYGSEYAGNSQPAANNSQWGGAAATSNLVPASPAPSVERNGEKYSVQPNDTFWTISERVYGTGAYFKALYEYNRKKQRQADDLVIGQELLVPDENVLRRHYPDLCPRPRKTVASTEQRLMTASTKIRGTGRVYRVVEGDTLYDVAKFELGKSSRWAEIYDLNRDILGDDFDYLRPGTELILPADSPRGDSVTRQPEQAAPNTPWR